jgi:uncharacterized repeat protein (TIGR01451 family)
MKLKLLIAVLLAFALMWGAVGGEITTGQAFEGHAIRGATLPPRPKPQPVIPPWITAGPPPDISIGMQVYPTSAKVGDKLTITITVINPEKEKANGVNVRGLIPAEFDIVAVNSTLGQSRFNSSTQRTQTDIQPLAGNTIVRITIMVKVNAKAQVGAQYYLASRVSYSNHYNTSQKFSNWLAVEIE